MPRWFMQIGLRTGYALKRRSGRRSLSVGAADRLGGFMIRFYATLTILIGLFAVSPALAADAFIATPQGVSFNTGGGYTRAPLLQPVPAGTQVMANESGSGWIVYCGCDVEIRPGKIYTVENRECKVESVNIRQSGLPHTVVTQSGQEELTRCRAGAAWWVVAGAAGVGVGICAAAGCFDDDDNKKKLKPTSKKKPKPMSP
jgi:hypothetical protein